MLNVFNSFEKILTPFLFVYREKDCMDKFVKTLAKIKHQICEKMREVKPMEITPDSVSSQADRNSLRM